MFNPKKRVVKRQQAVFSAFLALLLLCAQIPFPVIAGPSAPADTATDGLARALGQGSSDLDVARPDPETAETRGTGNRSESMGAVDHEMYGDPIFASIVREFADQDAYVAPAFVAGDGTAVNSVVFDGEGPCVPVLIYATESV